MRRKKIARDPATTRLAAGKKAKHAAKSHTSLSGYPMVLVLVLFLLTQTNQLFYVGDHEVKKRKLVKHC